MKNKITLEQAKSEVIGYLDAHYVDTDVETMLDEDAKEFNEVVLSIAKPVMRGDAVIDGKDYVLTLSEPQGDLKTITVSGLKTYQLKAMDESKKNHTMSGSIKMIAAMVKVPAVQIDNLPAREFSLLSKLSALFMVA